MRFLRRSLTGLFLLAATLGLLVYAGTLIQGAVATRMADEPRMPEGRERVFAVNVVTANPGTEVPVLTAYGAVESRRTLEIRTEAAGRIVELSEDFDAGGEVTEGQLLARIDPADAEAALARARSALTDARAEARDARRAVELAGANLEAAEEQVALYERAFARQEDLRERGVGSATAVETAELQASAARATVIQRRQALADAEARVAQAETVIARSELDVAEAERRLSETEIRAGFAGVLADVTVVEGRLVSANEQIATLIDPDALEVAFRVSTQGFARLLSDDGRVRRAPVSATLDVFGTDLVAEGVIDRASPQVAEGETGRLIYARLTSAAGFQPGDFVTVRVEEPPLSQVVRLPATALGSNGRVLLVGAEDRLEEADVTLLRRQGDAVLVAGEALAGRQVVAQRTPLLGPGIKVRTRDLDAGAAEEAAPAGDELMELSEARREKLRAFVEGNARMPEDAKERILAQLSEPRVPAAMVARLEARIGG
ncbi:HlyD family efflux transporter periplasmic adaptor subunit [Roseivivax sp. GX 12232]|uniref:efflux RND transporter periplasmic adaptor subunit n=1 Tax=Roseivivax sp. GX 12232 TaxID=2900547 RepID=UPI001E4CCF44|nr:HlyD family efflux transporter periplasmic adaptor subunit [Roseivivax sp. GX 12232]MCE0505667.1 HlyD family efflux transporter periplasmic adaptor subunit [Roseivivax sp. GX 12232]